MRRRHELTDAQWDKIKDPLPGKDGDPRRTAADNRLFVNAVLSVLKTGPVECLAVLRRPDLHEAFLSMGCSLIAWRHLIN